MTNGEGLNHNPQSYICKNCDIIARILKRAVLGSVIRGGGCNFLKCKQADVVPASHAYGRAGGTRPAAPVLAGPIFQAPTIFFSKKTKKNTYRNVDLYRYRSSRAGGGKTSF